MVRRTVAVAHRFVGRVESRRWLPCLARQAAVSGGEKLYFINLGAYRPGEFTELHANAFLVARDEQEVKDRAKQGLLVGAETVHTDDLFDLDDCLPIESVDGYHVQLEAAGEIVPLVPHNGYHIIPKGVVQAFAARRGLTQSSRDLPRSCIAMTGAILLSAIRLA